MTFSRCDTLGIVKLISRNICQATNFLFFDTFHTTLWKLWNLTATILSQKLRQINFLLKNFTLSWFDEKIFTWQRIFRLSTLCTPIFINFTKIISLNELFNFAGFMTKCQMKNLLAKMMHAVHIHQRNFWYTRILSSFYLSCLARNWNLVDFYFDRICFCLYFTGRVISKLEIGLLWEIVFPCSTGYFEIDWWFIIFNTSDLQEWLLEALKTWNSKQNQYDNWSFQFFPFDQSGISVNNKSQ